MKFDPPTVNVNVVSPAVFFAGMRLEIEGTGLLTAKDFEDFEPSADTSILQVVQDDKRRSDAMVATICVADLLEIESTEDVPRAV
jgi:hypothetical protein